MIGIETIDEVRVRIATAPAHAGVQRAEPQRAGGMTQPRAKTLAEAISDVVSLAAAVRMQAEDTACSLVGDIPLEDPMRGDEIDTCFVSKLDGSLESIGTNLARIQIALNRIHAGLR